MRRSILCLAALAAALLMLSCSTPKADLLLKNGEIYTMEPDHPWASALAVSGNKIVAVLDAEVNPYHISDDMRWMEERIGHERCKGAYAFQALLDNGALLSFGSDWPGTSAAEYLVHPRYLIHAAVNRTTLKGEPEGGWFPEQKIAVTEALQAYTINNAVAAFEGDLRGSLKAGKLADITVLDRNLLKIPPSDILRMNVDMTIVDGKVVFER